MVINLLIYKDKKFIEKGRNKIPSVTIIVVTATHVFS